MWSSKPSWTRWNTRARCPTQISPTLAWTWWWLGWSLTKCLDSTKAPYFSRHIRFILHLYFCLTWWANTGFWDDWWLASSRSPSHVPVRWTLEATSSPPQILVSDQFIYSVILCCTLSRISGDIFTQIFIGFSARYTMCIGKQGCIPVGILVSRTFHATPLFKINILLLKSLIDIDLHFIKRDVTWFVTLQTVSFWWLCHGCAYQNHWPWLKPGPIVGKSIRSSTDRGLDQTLPQKTLNLQHFAIVIKIAQKYKKK